jgi:hypothetical protein
MIDAFIGLLDGLYWEGYTEQLAKDDPASFNHEYNEFLTFYA